MIRLHQAQHQTEQMASSHEIDELLGIETPLAPLSQSLVKRYWDYKLGKYCGERLKLVDIDKKFEDEPSELMRLGHWFEYQCTGQRLRDGSEPQRPVTGSGKPTAKTLYIEQQAERFGKLIEAEQIDIQATGEVLIHKVPELGFRLKGVLDVRAIIDSRMSMLDIKSTGLLNDEWKDMGWNINTFNMRDKLTIQVVAYKYLAWKVWDIRDMPFYFALHSNANAIDSDYWEVKIKDFDVAMSHFADTLAGVAEGINADTEFGFTPHPTVKDCEKCPVNPCVFRIETPKKKIVTIDGIYHNDANFAL